MVKARTAGVIAVAALGLAAVGTAVGAVVGSGGEKRPAPAGAEQVVEAISEKWPTPNRRDTTSGCKADVGATVKGCTARITTDAVTVVELEDAVAAGRWAGQLGKAGDTRQAGRFVLSWTAREQALTSDEARADMVRIAEQQQS